MRRIGQITGQRMLQAHGGQCSGEGLHQHRALRVNGQNIRQRTAPQPVIVGKIRPDSHQQCPAPPDIIGDIVKIILRQRRLIGIAVKNDQIEFFNVLRKQLLHGKADQRQFRHRRVINPVGKAQNCIMHQIDIRVGFQHIAPAALARIGRAGHQQNLDAVTHPLNAHNQAVVDLGQLTCHRRKLNIDIVGSGMVQPHRHRHNLPYGGCKLTLSLPVDIQAQVPGRAGA